MTRTKNNIDSRKGKHLSYAEGCQIEVLKKKAIQTDRLLELLSGLHKPSIMKSKEGPLHN